MHVNFIGLKVYRNIGVVGIVVYKVFFDDFALIPAQDGYKGQNVVLFGPVFVINIPV